MQTPMEQGDFARHLRTALVSLYDPAVLGNSPLLDLLDADRSLSPIPTLRRLLTGAVESLRPDASTPTGTRTWRIYQILRRRYIEQVIQQEVAVELGLSVRQLQREESLARQILAEHLWCVYRLGERQANSDSSSGQGKTVADVVSVPSRDQELAEFREAVPSQMAEVEDVIQEVLETIAPLLKQSGVSLRYTPVGNLPRVWLQVPLLRQALLNVVSMAVRNLVGGEVHLWTAAQPQRVSIYVAASDPADGSHWAPHDPVRGRKMTERLIHLCRGTLEWALPGDAGKAVLAKITLPTAEKATVLAIDDNADTRHLFQRYLSGSRYRFVGAPDTDQGLELAAELVPEVIILDVMLPGKDGWVLLGQLREHPKTAHIPVVVCTILAQEELALALGAAEFVRKPVSRTKLLALLDRQLDPQ